MFTAKLPPSISIRFMFLSILVGILVVGTFILSTIIAVNEMNMLDNSLRSKGQSLASFIAKLSQDPLVMKDIIQLDSIVTEANKDEDILYAVIYDTKGNAITSQYASINYPAQLLKDILSGMPNESKFQDIIAAIKNKEAVAELSVPILSGTDTIGKVTIGMSKHKVRHQILMTILFVVVLALGVALALGAALFIASKRLILDPVVELAHASSRIAKGDLSTRVEINATGEVRMMLDSFNQMAEELDKTTVSKNYVDNIIKSMTDALIVASPDDIIMRTNAAASALLGYEEKELVGQPFKIILREELPGESLINTTLEKGYVSDIEITYSAKDDKKIPVSLSASVMRDDNNLIEGMVYVAQDISERKKAEEQLHSLAYYDTLTGLPNRVFFKELLKSTLEYAKRYNLIFSIFFIDLDDFKRINDTLGHDVGDQLLQAVANRLLKSLRSSDYAARSNEKEVTDVVSRQGGDEFILLLHNLIKPENVANAAGRILKELAEPFVLSGREVFISGSIGIALCPEDGDNIDSILKNADTAMYQAKSKGKNNYQFYSKQMNDSSIELLTLEGDLHRAIDRSELVLHYQPKVACSTGNITGVEALVRWRHPDRGLIPPAQFIPLAEASGLIIPIGEFVLHTACLQNKIWQEAGIKPMSVAVNLSSRQFDQKDLIKMVRNALNEAPLSPQYLELEVTESTIMRNPEEAIRTLQELKAMGIRIAVDDFGTGYSSLSYLKQLPLDFLKIDQSFVKNVSSNLNDAAIVRAIIAMAHSMNMEVIAEGVETGPQSAFLQEHGCDEMQGFLFCYPLPAEDISKLIAREML